MSEQSGDSTPPSDSVNEGKSSFGIGREHSKNPLLYLQQLMISVFVRTGKPVKEITISDITPEDIENAPKM